MKKSFLTILVIGVSLIISIFINQIYAISVADFTPVLDKKIAKMETTQEKVKWLQSFSDLLASPKFTKSKDAGLYKNVREYTLNMLSAFEHELWQEQAKTGNKSTSNKVSSNSSTQTTQSTPKLKLPHLSDSFSNIDEQKIRDAILSRHNEERKNVGANPYNYNLDLEGSATVRANEIANSQKTSNFHLRNDGDGYYNYNSILNRFSGLGINFPKNSNGGASFSETVGRNVYKCNKSDCTQDLINVIEKTWTSLIMKEKSSNGSHYKAATMKHFTQMGVGVAIDKENNRYYLVIHYGVEI